MKKSVLATLALAGASIMFGAPQSSPSKPSEPADTKTEAHKTKTKSENKKSHHKKEPKNQQTQTPTEK